MVENLDLGISLRFTPIGDKPLNQLMPNCLNSLNNHFKPLNQLTRTLEEYNYETLRSEILYKFSQKQKFRVSIGKSEWVPFVIFDEKYNLREILKDEIVIEFDCEDKEIVARAIGETGINLNKAGYFFEYWDHGGKSPHLHIHDLPISKFTDTQRSNFKKMFIKKYVPQEYHQHVDFSLTGCHLIALEWAFHWKGCYGYKKLINIFKSPEVKNGF